MEYGAVYSKIIIGNHHITEFQLSS